MPNPTPTSEDPHAWAKAYAKRGWRVLPIKPGEKRPPMAAWQEAATTDEATIDAWWTQLYKGHGIGIATGHGSGIFVLDVDVSDDKAGDETLNALLDQFGGLEDGPMAYTPSGGYHVYFRLPEGVEVRNDAGRRLGPGLDIRGEGGQVVAPPTSREEGGYEWDGDSFELPVPEAPRWLLERVVAKPAPEGKENLDAKAPQGKENVASTPRLAEADSPADRFNASTDWPTLLAGDGWTLSGRSEDGYEEWVRPGKDARKGASATVGWNGLDILRVFTTSIDWLPEGAYSRFQYLALRDHGGDYSAAAKAVVRAEGGGSDGYLDALLAAQPAPTALEVVEAQQAPQHREELAHLIDWRKFWEDDHSDEEWLAYPVIPKGRAISLYAPAKAGKSTIVLAIAAALATGQRVLEAHYAEPVDVLYLDYEMTQNDLQQRLIELGYPPTPELYRMLHYALLPSMPPLDTMEGAIALLELVDRTGAKFVVIDTFGRAVEGEEDQADTVRNFYRHTGLALKAKGITYLRTDHSGKDVKRGMRGSSAKNDDVDLVWQLTRADSSPTDHGVLLKRTHSRVSWVPEELRIRRVIPAKGQVRYELARDQRRQFPDGTAQTLAVLQDHGLEQGHSKREAERLAAEIKEMAEGQGVKMSRRAAQQAWEMMNAELRPQGFVDDVMGAPQGGALGWRTPNQGGAPQVAHLGGAPTPQGGAGGAPRKNRGPEGGALGAPSGAPSHGQTGAPRAPLGAQGAGDFVGDVPALPAEEVSHPQPAIEDRDLI